MANLDLVVPRLSPGGMMDDSLGRGFGRWRNVSRDFIQPFLKHCDKRSQHRCRDRDPIVLMVILLLENHAAFVSADEVDVYGRDETPRRRIFPLRFPLWLYSCRLRQFHAPFRSQHVKPLDLLRFLFLAQLRLRYRDLYPIALPVLLPAFRPIGV